MLQIFFILVSIVLCSLCIMGNLYIRCVGKRWLKNFFYDAVVMVIVQAEAELEPNTALVPLWVLWYGKSH